MLTLADKCTLARLVFAPVIVICYLLLPVEPVIVFWVVGLLCGAAELTDFYDGRIARRRQEVSDFGKLADPFCDVIYRLAVFMVYLLPIGGIGYTTDSISNIWWQPLTFSVVMPDGSIESRLGLVPFLPVLIMAMREIVAGALRSMAATKGLVLAARMSGKVKAWFQGIAVITIVGFPAVITFGQAPWHIWYATGITWLCALLSLYSISEYIWDNRSVLAQLAMRKQLHPAGGDANSPSN